MTDPKPLHILSIEDDAGYARLIQKSLKQEGFIVDIAIDGEKGLAMYDKGSYDVITIDYKMPAINGLEIIRTMASRGPLPPTIIITGAGNEEVAVEAFKLGACDYIVKDASGNHLRLMPRLINRVLSERRLIEEKNKALEELAFEHKLVQTLMDSVPDSIYFKDEKNRFVTVNRAKAENSNTTPENMVGKTDFDFLPKKQAEKSFEDDNRIMKSGKPMKDKVETFTRPDGLVRWVSATKIPWYDEKGKIIGTIGISRDMTQRKQAEEALNKEREKFISVLIHDLKGSLLPVIGYTKRLIDGKAKSKADSSRMLNIIQGSSQEVLQIIENTTRSLREKFILQSFHPKEVDFSDTLISIVSKAIPAIEERGIEISINKKKRERWNQLEKVVLKADPFQMKTLIENLLGNAIKYAKETIVVELKQMKHSGVLMISNDGPGIPEEYHERIFDEYFQIPGGEKGTGIGLYSVKRVVENHKGKIVVHSSPDKGTSFKITLPLSPNESIHKTTDSPS